MVDYSKITEEEVANKISVMPTSLKSVYESASFGFELMRLANDSFFDENEATELQMLVGLYLMGFMKEQELSEEIERELYLDPEESDKMVEKIRDLISTRSSENLRSGTPNLGQETRAFVPPKNDLLKPDFTDKRTAPPQVRVDFNSEPRTKSVVTSPDIHPENVIDLKDLPR